MARAPQRRLLKRSERGRRELSASDRGYDWTRWKPVADAVRERDEWLCQDCLREGGLAQAMDEMLSRPRNQDGSMRMPPVGHIKPGHVCSEAEFYDPANLRTQCDRHNALQREKDAAVYGSARR